MDNRGVVNIPKYTGPVAGFLNVANMLDLDLYIGKGTIEFQAKHGQRVNIVTADKKHFQREVRDAIRANFINQLAERANREGGLKNGGHPRKDKKGIAEVLDVAATCSNLKEKDSHHSYHQNHDDKHTLESILAGSIRPPHR